MGRRAAQLWKNQEHLTDLGIVNDTLTIEDQLRVKIALRMMRKAHTKTARSEAERKRRKSAKHTVEHIGEPNYASMQDDAVKIRTLEDIMKEARNNFALMKDQRKMEKDSHRYGQLRPIYTSLVNEIREEQMERQRLRDEREENEVWSLHSDGAGGKCHRPSRVTQGARRRKVTQRPHSAAATTGARAHIQSGAHRQGGGLHGSSEAPAKLQGERATVLSKASHHNVDPLTGQSANRRHELVPVRSAEVPTLEAEMEGQAHGRISRTQKELMNHVKNAQQLQKTDANQLPPLANNANKGRVTIVKGSRGPAPAKPLPQAGEESFAGAPSSGKFKTATRDRTASGGSRAEVKFAPSPSLHVLPEDGDGDGGSHRGPEDMEPEEAAENLVRLLKLGKYGAQDKELSERELTPSQMLAQASQQRRSFYADFDSGGESGSERIRSLVALREQASAKRSSFFSASAVRDDEKISRAQLQREEIFKVREDELKQRIMKKQQTMQSKAEQAVHEQRQRALCIAVISLARWSLLTDMIIKYRATHQLWKDANATKKAIGFIERWWRRGRVRILFRRHPHIRPLLRRAVMLYVWRLRLRRKRRAATLIVTFLQDSTGMSETMRAIYAFRHTVIRLQRWIRSWIEVQHCRMRILWLKCERMYRDKVRSERGSETTQEVVKSQLSQFAANYFTETAEEIALRRKQLGRLLEDQEFARAQRLEEARFQEEAMQRKKALEEARRRRQRSAKSGRLPLDSAKTVIAPSMKLPVVHHHVPGSKAPPKKQAVPWQVRIRSSASNCKIYDLLRELLGRERKRHILNLVRHQRVGQECKIGTAELRRYLKNPSSYDGAAEISKKLAEVQIVHKSPAQIYRSSFLLLTMGGIDALEVLIQTNRFIKF